MLKSKWLLFLARFLIFFAFFYFLWYFSTPVYNQFLAALSKKLLPFTESSRLTVTVIPEGRTIGIYHVLSYEPGGSSLGLDAMKVHFDLVLLLTLIFAVPKIKVKTRLKILLWGILLSVLVHMLKIVVIVKDGYASAFVFKGTPYYSSFERGIYAFGRGFFTRLGNQLVPLLIWSVLYVKFVGVKIIRGPKTHSIIQK